MSDSPQRRVHVVSLGCPKNRVDTELMMGRLLQGGFTPTPEAAKADVRVARPDVDVCNLATARQRLRKRQLERVDGAARV